MTSLLSRNMVARQLALDTEPQETVRAVAFSSAAKEPIFSENLETYRQEAAHLLADELVKLGCIEIDIREQAVLCGCDTDKHHSQCFAFGGPSLVARATIRLPDRSRLVWPLSQVKT